MKRIETYITLIHANNTPTDRSTITLHPNKVKQKATYSLKVDHMSSACCIKGQHQRDDIKMWDFLFMKKKTKS